jgi:acyl carrier protein
MQQGKATHLARDDQKSVDVTLRALLADVLGLPKKRIAAFDADTELFGALPEFDSLAVANLLTGIEERLSVVIEDDDVEAEDFMTYGRLLAFAERKAAA